MTSGGSMAPAEAAPRTGAARPRAVQRLVAVPWRHPALIVVCALGGAVAAAALSQRHHADASAIAAQGAHGESVASAPVGAPAPADAETLLQQAPPAANRIAAQAPEAASLLARLRGAAVPGLGVVAGLAAGLSLGLLAAAARELRGERMRSVGEAEWALGAPVLGAVPTLSGRSRRRLLAQAARRGPAAPR